MAIYGTLGDIEVSADYPSIQPTLDLNFAKTKALDPRITFYRNSLATYVDDKGIIRTVPENVPRFDHDPTTGESLGLLIEESRTNLLTHSEDLNQNLLSGYSTAIRNEVFNIAPPIIGGRVWYLSDPNTGTDDYIIKSNNSTPTGDISYSIFVKKLSSSTGSINSHFGNSISWNFDTGIITSNPGNYPATFESYPNGWYRLKFTRTYSGSTQTGININQGYYIGGIQIEAGSFATSYIPTSGSAVTRSADVCYMDGTNFTSWYNPNGGTAYIDVIPRGISNSLPYQTYFSFNSTSGDRWGVAHQNGTSGSYPSNSVIPYVGTGGAFSSTLAGTFTTGQRISVAMNQPNGTNIESSRDGASVQSVATSRNPAITNLLLGGLISDNSGLMGNIKRFTYYPKRLTNTQLQNLTA